MEPPSRLPSPSERDGLVYVGTLSNEKGVTDVLEIARQLSGVRIVLAGRGPLEQAVISASRELPNIEFRGRLDSVGVRNILSSARVAVVPSKWAEPGGLVVLEAMAMGTPVVAYRNGGLGEYVSGTNAGIVVDPSPSALAAACTLLLTDNARWALSSASGLNAIATEFAKTTHVRSVLEVYDRVLSERQRNR
jgi:glycosyltransferase involved in cell wall biosynthesis